VLILIDFCCIFRTVPTAEQIRVPETLLKKRKNQEKIAAEKAAALAEKRKVSQHIILLDYLNFLYQNKIKILEIIYK
jgi:hypothetical protein